MAFADLNQDGKADLVTDRLDEGTTKVVVRFSNGDGTFRVGGVYNGFPGSTNIRVADYNGDGEPDVAGFNGKLNLYPNTGNGVLGASQTVTVGEEAADYELGDLNGDGRADIVLSRGLMYRPVYVGNTPRPALAVYLSQANGSYDAGTEYAVGENPQGIAIGDYDGDGKADLAVANRDSDSVSVLINRGSGTFGPATQYPTSAKPIDLAATDLNGDGKSELVVSTYGSSVINLFSNSGNGTFGPKSDLLPPPPGLDYNGNSYARPIRQADFNGDGRADLLVAMGTDAANSTVILLNNGDGTLSVGGALSDIPSVYDLQAADVSGDGLADVLFGSMVSNTITTKINKGKTLEPPPPTFKSTRVIVGTNPNALAVGDLNGDGNEDLLTSFANGTSLALLQGNGDGSFKAQVDVPVGVNTRYIKVADVSGDGKPDLLTTSNGGEKPGTLNVQLNNGDGTFGARASYGVGQMPESVAVADFNGDGKPDLAVGDAFSFAAGKVSVLLNQGGGVFSPAVGYPAGNAPSDVEAGDLNGDGKVDLAVNHTFGETELLDTGTYLYGNGDGTFKAPFSTPYKSDILNPISTADFNGDGRPDVATSNREPFRGLKLLFGSAAGWAEKTLAFYGAGGANSFLAAGDLNNDGHPDLITPGYQSATVAVGYGDGSFADTTYNVPSASLMVRGDFNKDGKPDFFTGGYSQSLSTGLHVLVNTSPELVLSPDRRLAKAGDALRFTVTPTRALAGVPEVTLSGPCVETVTLPLTPTGYAGQFGGTYTVPSGTTNCDVTFSARGIREAGGGGATGDAVIRVDRILPITKHRIANATTKGEVYTSLFYLFFDVEDADSKAATVYYSLDDPACMPETPQTCTSQIKPLPDPGFEGLRMDQDGVHIVRYFSRDEAGNFGPKQTAAFVINATIPSGKGQTLKIKKNQSLEVTLAGTDAGYGDPLTYRIASQPMHGTLTPLDENKVNYTPSPGYAGTDRFTFIVNDGTHDSFPAGILFQITNTPPTAQNRTVTLTEEGRQEILLAGTDEDGDALTYTIVTPPAHGTLGPVNGNTVTYTPEGYTGPDEFTFKALDGQAESAPALVSLVVQAAALRIGSVSVTPGVVTTLPISATAAANGMKGLDLRLRFTSGSEPPPFAVTYLPSSVIKDWSVLPDPQDPWHFTLFGPTAIESPTELLRLELTYRGPEPVGTVFELKADRAMITAGNGDSHDVAPSVVPGLVTVIACAKASAGDVNGDVTVDVRDAVLALRVAVSLETLPNDCLRSAADTDCDGLVTVGDAVLILRHVVLGDAFPTCGNPP